MSIIFHPTIKRITRRIVNNTVGLAVGLIFPAVVGYYAYLLFG